MSDNAVIVLLIVVFFFLLSCLPGGKPPPKPKDDPDKNEQRRLALVMLKGEKTPEDIAAQEGYDIEHIKQWKADYLDAAEKDHNLRKKLDID
jgi:outer membrane biogenesis lipoprotein LolB